MKKSVITLSLLAVACFSFYNCTTSAEGNTKASADSSNVAVSGGFASQEEWGKHLVTVGGCNDCHTAKVMTAQGPALDTGHILAGSPSPAMLPAVMPEQIAKGMAATVDQTAWIGPWGKSYAANITSDSTGIGNWTEQQFITCLRKGVLKGLDGTRPLMPPMPWQNYAQMSDGEIKAMFAYLKSTKPVRNAVPAYEPPVVAKK